MSKAEPLICFHPDESYEHVPPENIISRLKREGEIIVVEYDDFFDPTITCAFPGLVDVDLSRRVFINTFKKYRGTDKPRFYPKCMLVERGADHVIVQRHDGVLFRINHAFPSEILLNIVNNPGITLWDLITLEITAFSKEYPDIAEEDLLDVIEATVDVIGFYIYVLDLVEMKF
ncbi:MAG: hypothetical protein QXG48_04495 [Thermofilaceae archaeon]